jgi:type II protein arginine methyltransferase
VRERSEAVITQEIDYAIHLGVDKIMFSLPSYTEAESIDNFARILNKYIEDIQISQRFILRVVIPNELEEAEKIYERYLSFKQLISHSPRVALALELEDVSNTESVINRFWGEPVQHIVIKTSTFVPNQKGHPVLYKSLQKVV